MYTREFIHTFREAVRDTDIPLPHKVLLFNMSTYANSDGGDVYPSQAVLARSACTSHQRRLSCCHQTMMAGLPRMTSESSA